MSALRIACLSASRPQVEQQRLDLGRFVVQSPLMDNNWAAENLQVIRTLMERSALYRRALAPVMLYAGLLGTAAGAVGYLAKIQDPKGFVLLWAAVGVTALTGAFLLVRRQAMRDAEAFWSPPTRHVSQALTPPLLVGALTGLLVLAGGRGADAVAWAPAMLPAIWMVFYGCSLTAAGFFMRRGIRVLGWIFVVAGSALAGLQLTGLVGIQPLWSNLLMGCTFGLLHIACGVYLYFTENSGDAT
jgi:hypothetical protein